MMEQHRIALEVNGRAAELEVEPRRTLADVLRDELGLTGTHLGCEHGVCGACTVLVDDAPARACILLAVQVDGHRIETVEGLHAAEGPALQQAFAAHHALQCGFCTPGFLMLAAGFLRACPQPSQAQIRELVASNLCRCTGYQPIIDAIGAVAQQRANDKDAEGSPARAARVAAALAAVALGVAAGQARRRRRARRGGRR